jgi:hypothetical protein
MQMVENLLSDNSLNNNSPTFKALLFLEEINKTNRVYGKLSSGTKFINA